MLRCESRMTRGACVSARPNLVRPDLISAFLTEIVKLCRRSTPKPKSTPPAAPFDLLWARILNGSMGHILNESVDIMSCVPRQPLGWTSCRREHASDRPILYWIFFHRRRCSQGGTTLETTSSFFIQVPKIGQILKILSRRAVTQSIQPEGPRVVVTPSWWVRAQPLSDVCCNKPSSTRRLVPLVLF